MFSRSILLCSIFGLAIGFIFGHRKHDSKSNSKPTSYKSFSLYAVASETVACSKIGKETIQNGGSVVDSAIASMFCVGVVSGSSSGIGGGHVAIIYAKPNNGSSKELITLIARERAPQEATEYMFANKSSLYGGLSIAIPGEVKGFYEAWKRFGWLPWKDLVQPTIDLMENGYKVEAAVADALLNKDISSLILNTSLIKSPLLRQTYYTKGKPLKKGDIVKDPTLASTLKMIARNPDDFYTGTLAKEIITEIQNEGGIMTEEDLANYKVEWKEPLEIFLNGNKSRLYSLRPPASGAVIALILNILKNYNFTPNSLNHDSKVLTYHRIIEAFRFAYAGRLELGDLQNITDLVSNMTSDEFAKELWKRIDDNKTKSPDDYTKVYAPWADHGTAHLSILAPDGSAIAMTSTINTRFGSLVKGSKSGIIYNNQMDDFSTPNKSNTYGYTPSPSNFIKPGKIPMSSMCPTLILDEKDKVRMVTGASGGSRIPTTTALIIMNCLWFNMTLKQATDNPRLHDQLLPNLIDFEDHFDVIVLEGLRKKGHNMTLEHDAGASQSIRNLCMKPYEEGCIEAASDPRKGGEPFGF